MSEGVLTSSTTVQNSTTESAALITVQHGANYLEVGKVEEVVMIGTVEQRSNPNAVLSLRVKYNGATIHTLTTQASETIATGSPFRLVITKTCRSTGVTGTFQINSVFTVAGELIRGGSVLTTIDTTSAQNTTVTAQWGEADPADIMVLEQGYVICVEPNR